MGKQQVRVLAFILAVLLVLALGLLLLPLFYHLLQVGPHMQGSLWFFGARTLSIHLLFILALIALLAVLRRRR